MLFDDDCGDEPVDRGVVGEHSHDVGASLDLAMEPLERVGGPDLAPVLDREPRERAEVVAGVEERSGHVTELGLEGGDDAVELGVDGIGVGLSEDRADRRGDHLGVGLGELWLTRCA